MSKLQDLLDFFPHLDKVPIENIMVWMKGRLDPSLLENDLGNRILYPQAVPVTEENLRFDLAVLRECLKVDSSQLYNKSQNKIFIPESFLARFPDLPTIVWAFIDALNPVGITSILLKCQEVGTKNLGTIIKPEIEKDSGLVTVQVNNQQYQAKIGSQVVIPVNNDHVDTAISSDSIKILGKNQLSLPLMGGPLGIIVDLRKGKA